MYVFFSLLFSLFVYFFSVIFSALSSNRSSGVLHFGYRIFNVEELVFGSVKVPSWTAPCSFVCNTLPDLREVINESIFKFLFSGTISVSSKFPACICLGPAFHIRNCTSCWVSLGSALTAASGNRSPERVAGLADPELSVG